MWSQTSPHWSPFSLKCQPQAGPLAGWHHAAPDLSSISSASHLQPRVSIRSWNRLVWKWEVQEETGNREGRVAVQRESVSLSHNVGSQFNSLHQMYMLGACGVPSTVLGAKAKVMSEAKILPLWNSYSSGIETDNT